MPCAAQRCSVPGTRSAPHRRARQRRNAASRPEPRPAVAAHLRGHGPASPPLAVSPCPVLVSPRPQRAPTEPLKGGLGAAGDHAAELGRLPRCHAQLRRLHGGGGGGGSAGCGETRGGLGLARPPRCCPQAVGQWEAGQRGTAGSGVCVEPRHAVGGGSVRTPRNPPLVTYPVCAPP